MKIYSFLNYKGGVGKTTLLVNIAACLANKLNSKGQPNRILVVDSDSQASASKYILGIEYWDFFINKEKSLPTLGDHFAEYIREGTMVKPESYIRPEPDSPNPIFGYLTRFGKEWIGRKNPEQFQWTNLHLIPAGLNMIDVDMGLQDLLQSNPGGPKPFSIMSEILSPLKSLYDYILIDCPPNFFYFTQNSIYFSDSIVIPFKPDLLSTSGVLDLMLLLKNYEIKMNKKFHIKAVIPTLHDNRVSLYKQKIEELGGSLRELHKRKIIGDMLKGGFLHSIGLQNAASIQYLQNLGRPAMDLKTNDKVRIQLEAIASHFMEK